VISQKGLYFRTQMPFNGDMTFKTAIKTAAKRDLDSLVDQVGLQRAALEAVARDGIESHARTVASKCSGAVELRALFDRLDAEI
jgi:hypothetical protein